MTYLTASHILKRTDGVQRHHLRKAAATERYLKTTESSIRGCACARPTSRASGMGSVMAAHQPNFLPYLGFFDKMMSSDIFVIRDEVQFVERDFHHRNRIKIEGTDGTGAPRSKWLTVPVYKAEAP